MVLTPSNDVPIGTNAPDFTLKDMISEKPLSLQDVKSDVATVVIFMCNHCPYVQHILRIIIAVANEYQAKGVKFVAINSNDVENYPDDSPEKMTLTAKAHKFSFPYLFDETQEVAKAYKAACTPDFFVYDHDLKLTYHGQFDDARPGKDTPVTGDAIKKALDAMISGQSPDPNQKPSTGCNIKWK